MCRIVVLHKAACCSLTDLCDAVPQTARFSAQTSSAVRCSLRQRVVQESLRAQAGGCSFAASSRGKEDQGCLRNGGQQRLEELVQTSLTGVAGRSVRFGAKGPRADSTDSSFRWREPRARARPPGTLEGDLERQGWNQAAVMMVV